MKEVDVKNTKKNRFNNVWWIPIIALLMALYLLISYYSSKGPLATIVFDSAESLVVEKTKVKYRDVEIGRIEQIELRKDSKVLVSVRMTNSAEPFLKEGSKFWVVRPRVGLTEISGLSTLISGSYIAIEPSNSEEYKYDFIGENSPPIISQDKPGLRLTLLADKATSVSPGSSIYYKGLPVGTVERKYFSKDYLWIKIDVFINAPHNELIASNSKFWSTSGVSIKTSGNGIEFDIESFEALVAGGITFETPPTLSKTETIIDRTEFILFNNKRESKEEKQGKKLQFITYFESSVDGLSIDSDVMIQGMPVGKVRDIKLVYDKKTNKTTIPILFEVYENRFRIINNPVDRLDRSRTIENLIERGLKTQLETANLLTGGKYISLVIENKVDSASNNVLAVDATTGYAILPSTKGSFATITSGISSLVEKVNELPIDSILKNVDSLIEKINNLPVDKTVNNLNGFIDKINDLPVSNIVDNVSDLVSNANKLVKGIKVDGTVKELNSLLKEGKTLSKDAKTTMKKFTKTLSTLSSSVTEVLSGFSPDAPLYYNLNKTLKELNETLDSFENVSDMLDRTPDALIFGEDRPRGNNK